MHTYTTQTKQHIDKFDVLICYVTIKYRAKNTGITRKMLSIPSSAQEKHRFRSLII